MVPALLATGGLWFLLQRVSCSRQGKLTGRMTKINKYIYIRAVSVNALIYAINVAVLTH